jgi:ketosteroid isomerase-like protein
MIRSPLLAALLFVTVVLASGYMPARADNESDLKAFKAAIRAQYDAAEQAYNKKDAEGLVNKLYAEDVIIVPPGPGLSIGRKQATAGYQAHLGGKAKIVSFKTHLNGNMGIDWANMYVTPDDPAAKPDVLKMLVVWEKRGGQWISISNMFTPGAYPIADANKK